MRVLGIIAGAVMTGLIAMGGSVHALDVADVVREWTPEGKKIAAERVKLPAHDEMVLIPAGSFIMGSDRKIDRNAYPAEFPQRKVYLDAYEIDKFEVTTVQFLKFILAKDLPPLIDWQYDGGNFQETMINHPVMHVSWADADAYCTWAGKRLPTRSRVGEGGTRERMGGFIPGGISRRDLAACELRSDRFVRTGARPSRTAAALSTDHFRGQVRQRGEPVRCLPDVRQRGRMDGRLVRPEVLRDGAGQESQGTGDGNAAKPFVVAGGSTVRHACGLLNATGLIPTRK